MICWSLYVLLITGQPTSGYKRLIENLQPSDFQVYECESVGTVPIAGPAVRSGLTWAKQVGSLRIGDAETLKMAVLRWTSLPRLRGRGAIQPKHMIRARGKNADVDFFFNLEAGEFSLEQSWDITFGPTWTLPQKALDARLLRDLFARAR